MMVLARHGTAGDVAAVVMEVAREEPPPKGFLEEVRAIADEFGGALASTPPASQSPTHCPPVGSKP